MPKSECQQYPGLCAWPVPPAANTVSAEFFAQITETRMPAVMLFVVVRVRRCYQVAFYQHSTPQRQFQAVGLSALNSTESCHTVLPVHGVRSV
jgi:hypothetical protein